MMRTVARILLAAVLCTGAIRLADADPLQPLINDLKSADTETALKAITGLGASGDIRAVPPLLEALRDERGLVRQTAVEALQHLVRALDEVYIVLKRWLQSLINKLQLHPSDDVITVEQPVVHCSVAQMGEAVLGASVGSRAGA